LVNPSEIVVETGPVPKTRAAALAFIFVTIVLDVLAMGVIIPILPKLVQDFLGGDTARAAAIFGLFGTVWAGMQFIFSPVLGILSDRFGRRRVILASNFGLGLDFIVMALAPTIGWLFVGRVISGITGASFTTAAAYIADVTPPEKRAAGYGMMGAAWGLGFILGPAFGGLLGGISPRLPFWVAAGLTLVNALYGFFVLPESLPPERRRAIDWKRANPIGSLKLLRSHHELFGLASVTFIYYVAHQVLPSVFVLYAGYRYGWNQQTVGLTLAAVGVCNLVVQGGLVKHAVAKLGERRSILTGLLFGAAGIAIFGLAPTGITFLAGIPVLAMMGLCGPSILSMMSHYVSPSEQGELQGANSSILGITGLIGPGLFTMTFSVAISRWKSVGVPGAPFLLAALLLLAAWSLAWRVTRDRAT
jgi:DHA1 family tetracycline resistance protein-like MFS transporter